MKDPIGAPVSILARMIRQREVSSQEVVNAHIERIEAVNPKLNAVAQLLVESAQRHARQADAALARGKLQARCTASLLR